MIVAGKQGKIRWMEAKIDLCLAIDVDGILRGQGADPDMIRARKPALVLAAERASSYGAPLIHPAVLLKGAAVNKHFHDHLMLENGAILSGPFVTATLGGAQKIIAVVITIGKELEQASAGFFDTDPLFALALDGLGNAAVEMLGQRVCSQISEQSQRSGLTSSTPISPGEPDWPVEIGQAQIFALIAKAGAEIQLTKGWMMIPKKSISFILGIGLNMTQIETCQVCSFRDRCRYHGAIL